MAPASQSAQKIAGTVETQFDYATVACFLGLAGAFFTLTAREPRTLLHFVLAGAVLAIANQVGNAGYGVSGTLFIIAGLAYAAVVVRSTWPA
jgi:hypothetical protein